MKILTTNQWKFAGLFAVLTIMFRYILSTLLSHEKFSGVWIIAVMYGIVSFIIGWIFGKKDKESLPIFDIGFRFHLITYVVFNLITELWHSGGFTSPQENLTFSHSIILYWGIGLFVHFIFYMISRKNTIKGIKKSDIFE